MPFCFFNFLIKPVVVTPPGQQGAALQKAQASKNIWEEKESDASLTGR